MTNNNMNIILEKPPKSECDWAMLAHLSALLGCFFPFALINIIGPLVVWLLKKEDMPFVDDQGREVFYFQISITLYTFVLIPFCFILIGIPFLIGLWFFNIIITIIAAVRASQGGLYRYPLNLIRYLRVS